MSLPTSFWDDSPIVSEPGLRFRWGRYHKPHSAIMHLVLTYPSQGGLLFHGCGETTKAECGLFLLLAGWTFAAAIKEEILIEGDVVDIPSKVRYRDPQDPKAHSELYLHSKTWVPTAEWGVAEKWLTEMSKVWH